MNLGEVLIAISFAGVFVAAMPAALCRICEKSDKEK